MSLDTTVYGVANDHEVFIKYDDSHYSGCDIRTPFHLAVLLTARISCQEQLARSRIKSRVAHTQCVFDPYRGLTSVSGRVPGIKTMVAAEVQMPKKRTMMKNEKTRRSIRFHALN